MSHSLVVEGIVPADEAWTRMATAYVACEKAKVEIPSDILDFFDGVDPREQSGASVDIPKTEYQSEMCEGYDIDVSSLPSNVKTIRVYISY